MDNICHTLVGAALGEAGLKRGSPAAVPTLLLGANFPDIDVVSYLWGPVDALAFRRGWTHGVLAMAVLPFMLAGLVTVCDRLVARYRPTHQVTPFPWLLVLSGVSIASHPILDYLNTYGVRFLMPFSGQWFYGDALFVVDPWAWIVLLVGVIWSRRGATTRPARVALALFTVYAAVMGVLSAAVARILRERLADSGIEIRQIMAAPVPLWPQYREVLVEAPDEYRRGLVRVFPRAELIINRGAFSRDHDHPAAAAAARSEDGRLFLGWSRFPYYQVNGRSVRLMDARYNMDWASATVTVEP